MPRDRLDPVRVAWTQGLIARVVLHNSRIAAICKEYNIGARQAERYVSAAREEIRKGNDTDRASRRDALRTILEGVVEDAIANGDGRTAVSGLRELVGLDGVAEPERIQVDASHTFGLSLDPAALRAQIRQAMLEHPDYVTGLLTEGELEPIDITVKPASTVKLNGSNGHNGTNGK